MGCVVVGVAAGDAGAVAHGDRGGGQLHQTLVLSVHRQLICRTAAQQEETTQNRNPKIITSPFCALRKPTCLVNL